MIDVQKSNHHQQVTMEQHNSYRVLTKIPGLTPLIVAATLSRLAGRMFILTLVLFVLARFSSPALAGWLTFAAIVPACWLVRSQVFCLIASDRR
ncbi:hypothetical protein [Rhizobium sp. P28RR-XV]|uniref:hypothetical protein n=1 Tax=Rhizobium sp. P28RR-XV TaxID=2726737 RepID=UPI001FEF2F8A|nr:hypothetical protein [Rhizobium sp. P28RR-XV]